jgi:hypothetical protein
MIKGLSCIGHVSTRHVPHGSPAALHFYRKPGEEEGPHLTLPVDIEKRRKQKAPKSQRLPF